MLQINEKIIAQICGTVRMSETEQGFILGSQHHIDKLVCCEEIPPIQTNLNLYVPNHIIADEAIHNWADNGYCFCGFLHSHIGNKRDFSEADIEFGKLLFKTYHLPIMWFGLALVNSHHVSIDFYSIQEVDRIIKIAPVSYQVTKC